MLPRLLVVVLALTSACATEEGDGFELDRAEGPIELYRRDEESGRSYRVHNGTEAHLRVWLELGDDENTADELEVAWVRGGETGELGWIGPEFEDEPWRAEVTLLYAQLVPFPEHLRGGWKTVRDLGTEDWAWPLPYELYGRAEEGRLVPTEGAEKVLLAVEYDEAGTLLHFDSGARMLVSASERRPGMFELYHVDQDETRTLVVFFEVAP